MSQGTERSKTLRIVLLESPLEIVPPEIRRHPQVKRYTERFGIEPSETLLDKTYHYYAMETLPEKWKRGRPDIVHFSILLLQDSLLNQKGFLETYIHVYDGRVFYVKPETRLPKHYDRFKGLMAQLLIYERLPPSGDTVLVEKVADSLEEFVEQMGGLILLWEKGKPRTAKTIVREAMELKWPIGVGMFPRGDFRAETTRLARKRYSLRGVSGSLKAWSVLHYLLCSAEQLLGILP
jgi:rRNA small subunit pseudouridine methyltransferase Nep1